MGDGRHVGSHDFQLVQTSILGLSVHRHLSVLSSQRGDDEHIGTDFVGLQREIVARVLLQDNGREGPKRLPVFHLQIYLRLHVAVAGITDDASSAQRARAVLQTAIKQADDPAIVDQVHDAVE